MTIARTQGVLYTNAMPTTNSISHEIGTQFCCALVVVVMLVLLGDSCYLFTHILQGCFTSSRIVMRLPCSPFYQHGLTLIPAQISNHMLRKLWNEITSPLKNFNGSTIEVLEWISNFISHIRWHRLLTHICITQPQWVKVDDTLLCHQGTSC